MAKNTNPDQARITELEKQLADMTSRHDILKSEHKARVDQNDAIVRLTAERDNALAELATTNTNPQETDAARTE